jgi:hypothetical protein
MKKKWSPSKRVRLALNAIGLLILIGLVIYLEVPREPEAAVGKCEFLENEDAGESASNYARTAASGYRNVRSRRVTLITFKEGVDPGRVLNNVCEQRWYAARLIPQLVSEGAAAIVFDKFFGPDSCPERDPGTSDLISAVKNSSAPVVVGVGSHAPESDPRNVCVIASKSLDFGKKPDAGGKPTDQSAVSEGLTRLNFDVRKVPLTWYSYSNDEAFKRGESPSNKDLGTLSWVAATLLDNDLKNEGGLAQLTKTGQHPFTSFIGPDVFSHGEALRILCESPVKADIEARYQLKCPEPVTDKPEIRGRIIVIGDDVSGSDRHALFGKEVAGVYLQANYIESLLDGRYLRPFGAGWNFAILALWVAFLYLIFWIQPEVGLLVSFAIAFLAKFMVIQLVLWKGLYPQIWVGELGFLAIVLKYADSRGHRVVDAIKEWREERHHERRKKKPPIAS